MKLLSPITEPIIRYYRENYIIPSDLLSRYNNIIINDINTSHNLIKETLISDSPCMISRFGSNELGATLNYRKGHPLSFLRKTLPFWVSKQSKERMRFHAGFFPNNNTSLSRFADLMIDAKNKIDILGTWIGSESVLSFNKSCKFVSLVSLEPFWSINPWTVALKGKKILVVHPFADSIIKQYSKREFLFDNNEILPQFKSLQVIKAVQSVGGAKSEFKSWFDALHFMEKQIDNSDYDIALIGCGAYGMPLAAHCKLTGKKAVHLGGVLQMLFGIIGRRWEDPNHNGKYKYTSLFNDNWIRPSLAETPPSVSIVEDACYW